MAVISKFKKLVTKFETWMEKISTARLGNDVQGRSWFAKSIEYTNSFKLTDLRNITDREDLNSEYSSKYDGKDAKSKKGISAIKVEISALYSFQKCFVQRYKGRMHYYRDDLSQKGARNMGTVNQSLGILEEFKNNLKN
jgi:hypothetical protein